VIIVIALAALYRVVHFVHSEVGWGEAAHVLWLGVLTMTRVIVLIALAALIWVPIGIRIGLNPSVARIAQPIAQFMAAFPANLMFPLAVMAIVRFGLNPGDLAQPADDLRHPVVHPVQRGGRGFRHSHRTAAGRAQLRAQGLADVAPLPDSGRVPEPADRTGHGRRRSWNASIVSEYVTWGDRTLVATGLGSYIAEMTARGDFPRIALGIGVMALFVVGFNRLLWNRLYDLAQLRTRL
jgi:NitT/TauT family transport system permease protein